MRIIELKERYDISNAKLAKAYNQFGGVLKELAKKELPDKIIDSINQSVEVINASILTDNELRKFVKKQQTALLKLVEKELKIVPLNHFRNIWLGVGMAAFGVPIGLALQVSNGSSGYFAIGFPIGMIIGIAIGTKLDKKAFEEGRQLAIEIR